MGDWEVSVKSASRKKPYIQNLPKGRVVIFIYRRGMHIPELVVELNALQRSGIIVVGYYIDIFGLTGRPVGGVK